MEFKVGSLMNLISEKSCNKTSTSESGEEKIIFQQKPKAASRRQSILSRNVNKSVKDKQIFYSKNDRKNSKSGNSMVKSLSFRSSLNFQGKLKRGTSNLTQGNKQEIAENSSQTVFGKSFKYINSENTSNTGDNITDGSDDKLERTVFVGNLPFTQISNKAVKKLFASFGEVESCRLRSVPVKDQRVPKKVAAIKADFHSDRTGTNAYVVMKSKAAAEAALYLNGTVLDNHHLRVDRADASEDYDPRSSIFLGNVAFKAEEDDLWALFEQCGDIDHVRILRDKITSVSKGAAYVNFRSADSVELALKMEGTAEINGRLLKIHRCLPGRKKSFHQVSTRQPGPRNTDESNDDKVRSKEEKRFQKKMKRREKREAENVKNEALGLRSRPLKESTSDPAEAKSFVGVKTGEKQQKRKKKRFNKGEVERKKVAKILTSVKSENKKRDPSDVVNIDEQQSFSTVQQVVTAAAPQASSKNLKKKLKGKVTKKAAPKTILLQHKGEIKKKKLRKVKT